MALEILTIASSSKGNCICIRNDSLTLLIDMGISLCHLKSALDYYKINIGSIKGILITHEHSDHINGLKTLLKGYDIPVYANRESMNVICDKKNLNNLRCYDIAESGFSIEDIDIQPFRTRHDSVHSLGYTFSDTSGKISIATDLGCVTAGVINNLTGSDIVLIESNHDEDMLKKSHYPKYIQNRILSNVGHLSNDTCADTIARLADAGTRKFILGHLSENNNTRRLAYSVSAAKLTECGYTVGRDVILDVASASSNYVSYCTCEDIRQIV